MATTITGKQIRDSTITVDDISSSAQEQFAKLRKFFDTMPKLRHECKVKNPKTGVESTITFSGLQDFFGLASPTTA